MARIIGCRDLHYAILKTDKVGGKATYDEVKKIPSLINISISDTVEQSKFYSDDQIEQNFSKTAGKEVEIELGYITNELEADLTGKTYTEDGVLIQKSDDTAPEIAIMFRAPKSKNGAFRYLKLFKGTLSRTESEYATQEDGVESSTVKLTGVFISLASNSAMGETVDSDDVGTEAVIAKWFTEVVPNEGAARKAKTTEVKELKMTKEK